MIRVVIVHEVKLICDIIAAVVGDEPDLDVVGYATNVDDALAFHLRCDVILASMSLPQGGAHALTKAVARIAPRLKVLVMGLAADKEVVLQCIEAGAAGYVLEDDSVEDLLQHIRAAYNSEAVVSPQIASALMRRLAKFAQARRVDEEPPLDLTPREAEVLDLLGHGLSNREIARRLVLELGTVKNHVHNILVKLDVDSRQEAAAYWRRSRNRELI